MPQASTLSCRPASTARAASVLLATARSTWPPAGPWWSSARSAGDVLDSAQQAAFQRYIRGGRGFVGVHSASDTEYDWPWFGQLVGAYFKSHPRVQEARLDVRDRTHLSTKCLPAAWTRRDEWYDFRAPPPADAKVLVTIDEKSYSVGTMGDFHPMVWHRTFDGGRTIYSEMGHTHESWKEQAYLDHLAGAILWATGLE